MFEQDSALAHRVCEMVAFLDRKTPNYMTLCCLMLTRETFFISEPIKFTIEAGQQLAAPVETMIIFIHTIKLVPVTHYVVSITSRLAKNI